MKPLVCQNIDVEGVANIQTLNVDVLNSSNQIIRSADSQFTSLVNKTKGTIKSLKNGIGLSLYPNDNTIEIKTQIYNKGEGVKLFDVLNQKIKTIKSDTIDISSDENHIYLNTSPPKIHEIVKYEKEKLEFIDSDSVRVERNINEISLHTDIYQLKTAEGEGLSLIGDGKIKRLNIGAGLTVSEEKDSIYIANIESNIVAGKNCVISKKNKDITIDCIQPDLSKIYEKLEENIEKNNANQIKLTSNSLFISKVEHEYRIEQRKENDNVNIKSSTLKILTPSKNKFLIEAKTIDITSKSLTVHENNGRFSIENYIDYIGYGTRLIYTDNNSMVCRTVKGTNGVTISDDETLCISYNLRNHLDDGVELVSENKVKRVKSDNLIVSESGKNINISLPGHYIQNLNNLNKENICLKEKMDERERDFNKQMNQIKMSLTKEIKDLNNKISTYDEKFSSVYKMIEESSILHRQEIAKMRQQLRSSSTF
ncbi:MAG: hypothetical protein CMB64_03980 [Euryarchaeota archaeon]|nr:hypothetical protein [Euryarchaeota archaeon]|tara:strand:+ start:298 stop:1743 length:1446 start_codon:yes stop_codon:yes gene_type:complete